MTATNQTLATGAMTSGSFSILARDDEAFETLFQAHPEVDEDELGELMDIVTEDGADTVEEIVRRVNELIASGPAVDPFTPGTRVIVTLPFSARPFPATISAEPCPLADCYRIEADRPGPDTVCGRVVNVDKGACALA